MCPVVVQLDRAGYIYTVVGVGLAVGRKVSESQTSQQSRPKYRVDLKPKRDKGEHVANKTVVFLDYAGRLSATFVFYFS